VASANYNLPKLIGTPPPAGADTQNLEKSTTDKAKVVNILKMPDEDLEKVSIGLVARTRRGASCSS
jgi:hypothetical protein